MLTETESNESFWQLVKKGNKSSAIAMGGNAVIAAVKGIVASMSGSSALFASAMHSFADTINQGFVFVGSVLSEKAPTRKFPTGFGRVINIFCMVAVIVVTIMAYETIHEGWHSLSNHEGGSKSLWLSIAVLLLNLAVDGSILVKAMKEITHEARVEAKGFGIVGAAFKSVGRAAPPTRLVFYEDLVAVSGAGLALAAIVITALTDKPVADGVATILIGVLMLVVAFRVGFDNMVGLIGVAAPEEIQRRVTDTIFAEPRVCDINELRVIQEGRYYHVEGLIELQVGMTLADADDVKFRVRDKLLQDPDISDVTLGIIEDNGVRDWVPQT
ncbi:cation diffusion facilitator family transporter [Paenibacillus sp. MWE-103]|uniref:Cation diffusion facilitator family transporter n=1 Tax=Paenibacillus artemisiicola TaxID=1172618 RepID=A0ABS3WE21_9BACL|nr:cation diffusion facilitator family transporter [Paenibacillus artemisiicola]MBO7746552.1 cation diffusion facilitator family transporter [Paenibacillus artemisiicola]